MLLARDSSCILRARAPGLLCGFELSDKTFDGSRRPTGSGEAEGGSVGDCGGTATPAGLYLMG